uniref:Uncharacterized protein n=1 Tax=Arion vulgaris TaxID=1028688 RepID=A0A0B7AW41_9EUPU
MSITKDTQEQLMFSKNEKINDLALTMHVQNNRVSECTKGFDPHYNHHSTSSC